MRTTHSKMDIKTTMEVQDLEKILGQSWFWNCSMTEKVRLHFEKKKR